MSDKIVAISFQEALSKRYLSYAMSTIVARSLPDVRDGFKPVHRRLIYAMYELNLSPENMPKKCGRIAGDTVGKFHPHGDVAVYEALVRLAQPFSMRYPLVDGIGNFGNIDGDGPAAMRYTEARFTPLAMTMLEGIEEDAVPFRPNYDGTLKEPVVMPGLFPNLLANGAMGIAVGMATSIPPHNMDELCQALDYMLTHPNATVPQLMKFIQGPDFPTGGELITDAKALEEAYTTGRGQVRLRARYTVEQLKNGQYHVVITEIPYMVAKGRLLEKIAELLEDKKLPLLGDVYDESADDVRIILEPKTRNILPEQLMATLFKITDLEVRIPFNMNVVDDRMVPRLMSLPEILAAYLAHRQQVLINVSQFRLNKVNTRLEILEGLLIIFNFLDEVIRIIRTEDEPKAVIMARWSLTDLQAEAILNTRLRSLRKLEEQALRRERDILLLQKKELEDLLASPDAQRKALKMELAKLRKAFGQNTVLGKRRTTFTQVGDEVVIDLEVLPREPVTIVCSQNLWIRCLKGHVDASTLKYKDGDAAHLVMPCHTTDKIVLFTAQGRAYTLSPDKLPSGRGDGEPLRLHIELDVNDRATHVFAYNKENAAARVLLISSDAYGFVLSLEQAIAQTRTGKKIMTLNGAATLQECLAINDQDTLALLGENRRLAVFPITQIPELAKGRGPCLQKYQGGTLKAVCLFKTVDGLTWRKKSSKHHQKDLLAWQTRRGGRGRFVPTGFPEEPPFFV